MRLGTFVSVQPIASQGVMTGKRDAVNEFAARYATSASAPSAELRRQYEEEGFILLSGLIDDETSRAPFALGAD